MRRNFQRARYENARKERNSKNIAHFFLPWLSSGYHFLPSPDNLFFHSCETLSLDLHLNRNGWKENVCPPATKYIHEGRDLASKWYQEVDFKCLQNLERERERVWVFVEGQELRNPLTSCFFHRDPCLKTFRFGIRSMNTIESSLHVFLPLSLSIIPLSFIFVILLTWSLIHYVYLEKR